MSYTDDQIVAITWDQFREMFCAHYIPQVEPKRLAQEFLVLRQGVKSVTEITHMFTERAMFFLEFASKQARCHVI